MGRRCCMAEPSNYITCGNYEIGTVVYAYTHRRCGRCCCWFKFRFDKAVQAIRKDGYYKVVCPACDSEYVYEREDHLPNQHMKFIEVD